MKITLKKSLIGSKKDQIATALKEQLGVEVDKRKIEPEEPIKSAGQSFVNLKLMAGVSTRIIVNVKVAAK